MRKVSAEQGVSRKSRRRTRSSPIRNIGVLRLEYRMSSVVRKSLEAYSRVRPEDRYSCVSSRLKAIRSETCSPLGSMTRSRCPARNSNATPERGGISARMKRARPVIVDGASTVLTGFRAGTKRFEHGIRRSFQLCVALDDGGPNRHVFPIASQSFDLCVLMEYQARAHKAPRSPARARVQAYDIVSAPTHAEAEVRRLRVFAHPGIPFVMDGIGMMHAVQILP